MKHHVCGPKLYMMLLQSLQSSCCEWGHFPMDMKFGGINLRIGSPWKTTHRRFLQGILRYLSQLELENDENWREKVLLFSWWETYLRILFASFYIEESSCALLPNLITKVENPCPLIRDRRLLIISVICGY